jgi:hypothetical protein
MKITITLLLTILLTGCAQAKYQFMTSVDIAREECAKIGYKPGTVVYANCVERQAISIRNSR